MAQKRKRKNRKKLLFWLIMLVLVAVAVGVCYLVWQTYFSGDAGKQEDETSKTEDEKDEINENNGVVTDENGDEIEIEGKEKVVQYEGNNPNKAQDLSGAITFADAVDGKLMIRMNIDQYLSGGDCELVLKRNGSIIYSADAGIDSGASTSTCKGFDVLIDNIGRGEVDIEIYLSSDGREGVIYGEANI